MNTPKLPTDAYKGVRDFYPADMAVQRYIFDSWSNTAERFGFERYDTSILEPAELYRSKGAQNTEIVNEQTYTFTDRGDREVTLRPEMTPSVARLIARKRRELQFPVRWYSIPNLFRYERPQRGRLREHWQLNCDIFGGDTLSADVEMLSLAVQIIRDFGATDNLFELRLNSRALVQAQIADKLKQPELLADYFRLLDKKAKISAAEFQSEEAKLLKDGVQVNITPDEYVGTILQSLQNFGITNVVFDSTITRGFDYYTGLVFEIFDVSGENNRAMLGGGRYDNLTTMFDGEPISGVGFGMGDVTMRDFLTTHDLLPESVSITAPQVVVIPMDNTQNLFAEGVAHKIRQAGFSVTTDISNKKTAVKIGRASERGAKYISVIGEDEVSSDTLSFKHLATGEEKTGPLGELINFLTAD